MNLMSTYLPPPQIAPLAGAGPRPFWSVMIPTYNRLQYLEKTLKSVLAQCPGAEEMQIEVIDNGSTICDPEPLVRRLGGSSEVFSPSTEHRVGDIQ